jgi:hypothetical protein
MYGGSEGPTLLLNFETPLGEPIFGLQNTGNLITGEPDPIDWTGVSP